MNQTALGTLGVLKVTSIYLPAPQDRQTHARTHFFRNQPATLSKLRTASPSTGRSCTIPSFLFLYVPTTRMRKINEVAEALAPEGTYCTHTLVWSLEASPGV